MPGKRSTTPLFDLLQQGRARGVEVRLPDPALDRPRAQAPEPKSAEPRQGGSRFADSPIRVSGGVVQLPLGYAAAFLAVALAAVLGAWWLGYERGEAKVRSADQALLESVMGSPGTITEPDEDGGQAETPRGQPDGGQAQSREEAAAGPAPFITARGGTGTDPRLPNHNYLYLAARLNLAAVQSAMAALEARGIDSFAEIDPSTLRRKDGPLYSLIAGKPVPSGETGSTEAKRYRAQVLAAGAAWKQEGGIWDFADAYWDLYDPKTGR